MNKLILFISISLIFLNNYPLIYCQQSDFIRGKVIDSKTSEPVSFAAVRLKNAKIGIYTNAEGDFKILNNLSFQYDSLVVTSIGFRRLSLAYDVLKKTGMNILKISPDIYRLKEVAISAKRRRLNSVTIVARALRNIKKNSPDKPFSYVSYYRDYQKDSSNYLNLNEAIIQTLDLGFNFPTDSNKYRLLDFKKNLDFMNNDMTPYYDLPATDHTDKSFKRIPYAFVGDQNGNEFFILLVHDAIRNFDKRSFSFVDTLSQSFLRNHRFSDPIGIHDGGTLLYKIAFSTKRQITGDSLRMGGTIFIQPDDFSIHKLEYSAIFLDSEKKEKDIFKIEIVYGNEPAVDSRMCLKYISFSNSFFIPDSSDNNFFKIVRSEWSEANSPYANYPVKSPNMTIKTTFNRRIDPALGVKMDNYYLTIGKRKAKITRVWVSGQNLFITVRDDKFNRKELDSCNLNIKNLKDINGNLFNKQRDIEFHQFRELFVQEYNSLLQYQNDCLMQSIPLEQNCITISEDLNRFWMNTPLKTEEKQKDSNDN